MYGRIRSDVEQAVHGWQHDRPRMIAQLIVSYILGQGIFWRWGYDQISHEGQESRVMQAGYGQKVGPAVYKMLPHSVRTLYAVKTVEVLADLGKCYIEGTTYQRNGVAPDVVAAGVTQPAWSLIEAVQKLFGLVKDIDLYRNVDEEEFTVAISCIYGSFFRYGQAAVMLALGNQIDQYMTRPLERLIRRTGPLVPALAAVGLAYQTAKVTRRYQSTHG